MRTCELVPLGCEGDTWGPVSAPPQRASVLGFWERWRVCWSDLRERRKGREGKEGGEEDKLQM